MTVRSGSMPVIRRPITAPAKSTISTSSVQTPLRRLALLASQRAHLTIPALNKKALRVIIATRSLAQVRHEPLSELWFTASFPISRKQNKHDSGTVQTTIGGMPDSERDHKRPDERTLKLGKTLRALSPLLPTILTTPLPQDILSPNITLHLFPSTHPHLPVVKGRVAYRAALWTAPVAWGTVPIVGNVKLEVISEKIVRTGYISAPTVAEELHSDGLGEEKLVVRWRTETKTTGSATPSSNSGSSPISASSATENGGLNRGLSTLLGGTQPLFGSANDQPFTGLFIFSFDKEGRIASQTIEHADENQGCDKTSRVVTLTDWLLGKAKWGRMEQDLVPGLAMRETVVCRAHADRRQDLRRWDWAR